MAVTPPVQPQSGWTITGQTQGSVVNDSGQVVQGVNVFFRTGNGTSGSVFVPQNLYSVDNVRTMIAQQAATIDAIDNLTAEAGS
jgi:hypothetical protein